MDPEVLKWMAGLGGGSASIAGLLFYFYRKDVRGYTEVWQQTAAMLTAVIEKSTSAHVENTQSNREMIGLLRAMHRRLDADQVPPSFHSRDEARDRRPR